MRLTHLAANFYFSGIGILIGKTSVHRYCQGVLQVFHHVYHNLDLWRVYEGFPRPS